MQGTLRLCAIIIFLIMPTFVFAQSSSPTPKPNAIEALKNKLATRAAEITRDLQEKIATTTAQALKKSVTTGTVVRTDAKNLVVKTKLASKTISLTPETSVRTGKTRITAGDLEPEQKVVVLANETAGVLIGQHVYVLPDKPQTIKDVVFGTVTEATAQSLTVQHPKNRALSDYRIDEDTKVSAKGGATASLAKLTIGSKVLVIAEGADEANLTAIRIHIIASGAAGPQPKGKSGKEGTSSADMDMVMKLAQQKLAGFLNVPATKLKVSSKESVTWGDTGLGVKEAGKVYAQVITPGFILIFSLDKDTYEMHTDAQGTSMVLVEPLKRF